MPSSSRSSTPSRRIRKKKIRKEREVLVHSSLPPLVDGQIRCFLVVKIKKLTWKIKKQPDNVFLRAVWWGESVESAAVFSPSENKIVARYPVRSGPKQMASYLTDASALHVDVLRSHDMCVIGKVQIYGLSTVAAGKSITGPYPIFSTKSEIIGHININISIQSIGAFDDSGGSSIIPTTDMNSTEQTERIAEEDKLISKNSSPSAYSSILSNNKLRGESRASDRVSPKRKERTAPKELKFSPMKSKENLAVDSDLISNLLVKGQRLREAMTVSAIDTVANANEDAPNESAFPVSRRILSSLTNKVEAAGPRDYEQKTVDLVLGSSMGHSAVYLSSDDEINSLMSEDLELSDPEDPIHDQQLLDLLFYKNSTTQANTSDLQLSKPATQAASTQVGRSSEQAKGSIKYREPKNLADAGAEAKLTRQSSIDDPGNSRPPSRTGSASPHVLESSQNIGGYQSDSGASHVSFDLTPSDDEDVRKAAEGLTVEQLTLLARVSVARVHIDKLLLKERPTTPVEKTTYKGRPPPAKPSKYGTYFVEYQFPVMAASRDHSERTTSATETVRAVSKKVEKSGNVMWNHHMVFPVYFTGQEIEKWWSSMLVLKIHHRSTNSKTATLIGSCSVQMKQILQSLTFGVDLELSVTKHTKGANQKKRRRRRTGLIGLLKLSIQLDSDSPSFATALREMQINKARKQNPLLRPKPETPLAVPEKPISIRPKEPVTTDINKPVTKPTNQASTTENQIDTVLHLLLHVSDARKLKSHETGHMIYSCGDVMTSYIVCRLFWSGDKVLSDVSWNTATPNYRINENYPVHVTNDVLTKMSNNYMIVEVWEKRVSVKDQLVGIVKLPLNSFFMSFKDERISNVLFKSQYPVIAVDSYLPIYNPLTAACNGELKVLLAMGTQEQIMSLETLKVISAVTDASVAKERTQDASCNQYRVPAEKDGQISLTDEYTEHRFDIKVVGVRNFSSDTEMFLGEADCFIQYHFPTQQNSSDYSDSLVIKTHRGQTTLCTDDITFDDQMTHVYKLPSSSNVQSLIASAFGKTYGASIPLEFWCRFYHPNTRDQLMSKCLLPLSKLLAMVTMTTHSVSCQSFSLPLLPAGDQSKSSNGVMDVSVRYSRRVVPSTLHTGQVQCGVQRGQDIRNIGHVTLSVLIESVTGLKSGALALSKRHQCLDYYSAVGVNLYTKQYISFLPGSDTLRVSDTEARVLYLEEYNYRTQYLLPLLIDNSTSLAECMKTGNLIVEVWHQSVRDGILDDCPGIPASTDILLGVATIPLSHLLTHKSGLRRWFPIGPPADLYSLSDVHDPMMGALKVQMNLTGSNDINNIIDAASKVGYELSPHGVETTDVVYDELTEITVEVDWFSFPAHLVMRSNEDCLPLTAYCYVKTNFYNNDPAYSIPLQLTDKGDNFEGRCEVKFKFLHSVNTSFIWYLFDQDLALDLWFTTRNIDTSSTVTPSTQDKYLGTAYIPLEHLSKRSHSTLSDVYPIYRPDTERMGRALLQAHLNRRPHKEPEQHVLKAERKVRMDESNVTQIDDLDSSGQSEIDFIGDDCMEAMIFIEEANRLHISNDSVLLYMTYSLAGKEHKTHGVKASAKPSWMYEKCVKLSLTSIQQAKHLVLKLWTKSEETGSQVVGFTTIDLRPLLAGMPKLCGWYNIVDFTGLCQGQIKCGVEPLNPVPKISVPSPRDAEQYGGSSVKENQVSSNPPHPISAQRYTTESSYKQFPSHISRFTEQRVHYAPLSSSSSSAADLLKKQLADLDLITNNLRKRLYQSSAPSAQGPLDVSVGLKQISPSSEQGSHVSNQTGSSLLQTVKQVQDNMQRLANEGIIQPDHPLVLPPLPPFPGQKYQKDKLAGAELPTLPLSVDKREDGRVSESHVVCPDPLPNELLKKLTDDWVEEPGQTVSNSATSTDILTTPRTQRTYSVTSEDEETYSPPVILSVHVQRNSSEDNQTSELNRNLALSDGWDSDGVKPLESDDDCSDAEDHDPGNVKQLDSSHVPDQGHVGTSITKGTKQMIEEQDTDKGESDEESEDEADEDEQLESDDGEYEPAFSRTLNEDITATHESNLPSKPRGVPPTKAQPQESASKDTLYNIPEISTSDSGHVTQSRQEAPPSDILEAEGARRSPDVSSIPDVEDNECIQTPADEAEEPAGRSGPAADDPAADDPAADDPAIDEPATVSQIPSFFPTREELEAKLKAAAVDSKQSSGPSSRFSRRVPVSELMRRATNEELRARQLENIFSSKFNN